MAYKKNHYYLPYSQQIAQLRVFSLRRSDLDANFSSVTLPILPQLLSFLRYLSGNLESYLLPCKKFRKPCLELEDSLLFLHLPPSTESIFYFYGLI